MSKLKSYMEGKELRFKVSVGRKTFKGFKTPREAAEKGIEAAVLDTPQVASLLHGKPLERKVGIIFGRDVMDQYFSERV